MPIYEYECSRCFARFELRRRINESAVVTCPRCQGEAKVVFAPVPVIFKGSGFYTTDSRGSKEGKPESGKGEPSGKEENEGD